MLEEKPRCANRRGTQINPMEILTMLQLLTAPETLAQPTLAHRFLVELASTETELNHEGVPVPKEFKTIDVCFIDIPNLFI